MGEHASGGKDVGMQLGNARHASGGVDSSKWARDKNRKEKRMGHCLGLWFGLANGGGK